MQKITSSTANSNISSDHTPPEAKSGFSNFIQLFPWLQRTTAPPAPIIPDKSDTETNAPNVFYLAYGSNLSASTFQGRREIRPISATNVRVPSLALTFSLPGLAYLEPCFANVRYSTQGIPEPGEWEGGLIGVVYEVTAGDYAKILATEGGGASYKDVEVPTFPLDRPDESIIAHTLFAPSSHLRAISGQPSRRYLNLLRAGAKEHALPEKYRLWLDELQAYRKTTMRQWVGAVVWTLMWLPPTMVIMGLMRVLAGEDGRGPKWVARMQRLMATAMWGIYDTVFKGVFGDGERTMVDKEGERAPLIPI